MNYSHEAIKQFRAARAEAMRALRAKALGAEVADDVVGPDDVAGQGPGRPRTTRRVLVLPDGLGASQSPPRQSVSWGNEDRGWIGPRRPGGRYYSGYWHKEYQVIWIANGQMKVRWEGGSTAIHCSAWDKENDRVVRWAE